MEVKADIMGFHAHSNGFSFENSTVLLDRLADQVRHVLHRNPVDVQADVVDLDFLFWLDGTSSGLRAVTAVKFRLLDCLRFLFPTGLSAVTCWMDTFCKETAIRDVPHQNVRPDQNEVK